jgi:lysophospholipase L1-like esterase
MGRPLSTVVLAVGGETIREVAKQISLARDVGAKHLFIAAGLNDIILQHEPTEQIARSFDFLLRRIDVGQTALVTLIPYVSDPALAPSIRAANAIIADIAERRGFVVIDLNPILASKDNVRGPEMTTDGLHFTSQACAVWMDAVKAQIPRMGARW